jgi:putative colanic acid biosysnthesis UDP-glucose lipid carrier transferase
MPTPLKQPIPLSALNEWSGVSATPPKRTSFIDMMQHIADLVILADICLMLLCGYISYQYRYAPHALTGVYLVSLVAGTLLFAAISYACGVYEPTRLCSFKRQMVPFAFAHVLTPTALITGLFFTHLASAFSRIWIGLWFTGAFFTMLLLRVILMQWTAKKFKEGAYARQIVLVGSHEKTQLMLDRLSAENSARQIVGVCILDGLDEAAPVEMIGVPEGAVRITRIEDLADYCRIAQVDEVIITSDLEKNPNATAILSSMEPLACSVKYCIPGYFFSRPLADVELLNHIPIVTIFRSPLKGRQILLKRVADIIFSLILLIVLSPLLLTIAALVALDGQGHILFWQRRHGFGGNEFSILKFRSMRVMKTQETQVVQATRDDDRTTRIGRFIRRTSLDELPQLLNVLKGDMSLVGPRPHALSHNHYYQNLISSYAMRHRIKPGITGLAQVNGCRGATETVEKMQRRVEHDLYYIENWSLWLDVKILVQTAFTFLWNKNAY